MKNLLAKISLIFRGLKSEYNKIIFPSREKLIKDSISVFIISVIIGALIFALDSIINFGFGFVLK